MLKISGIAIAFIFDRVFNFMFLMLLSPFIEINVATIWHITVDIQAPIVPP